MSRLVLALLADDSDKLESFHELDMSWADEFNKQFEANKEAIPYVESVYQEEFCDMSSYAVLNNLVITESDEEFRVNRTPLINILHKLFWGREIKPIQSTTPETPQQ